MRKTLFTLNYRTSPPRKIASTASDGWYVTLGVFAVSVGLVLWGWLSDTTAPLVFGVILAAGIGFVTLERLSDYRVFLIDRYLQKFIVKHRSFGRTESIQEYDLDLLSGFEEEKNPDDCHDTRIFARLSTGERIYLHERLKGASSIGMLERINAQLRQFRHELNETSTHECQQKEPEQ